MNFKSTIRDWTVIFLVASLLQTLIYLPFILQVQIFGLDFSPGFLSIYRNYDGLNYIVVAKSLYQPHLITAIPYTLAPNYYAAHFPGYALSLITLAPIFGFLKSMLLIPFLFTIFSSWALYSLLRQFHLTTQPLFLSLVFLIIPPRWLIVHSIGSPEPMFIFFTIMSLFAFLSFAKSRNYIWIILTAVFASVAQLTRPPGILLFFSFTLYLFFIFWQQKIYRSFNITWRFILTYIPLLLIPLTLTVIFWGYSLSYHDFWAYFHSGDNIHLQFLPFSVFNKSQFWVGDIWLEDILYILFAGFIAGLYLLKSPTTRVIGFYVLTYTFITTLVAHRDISRYILPIAPFALIAFEKLFTSREFKIVLTLLLLGIYLYSQNFLLHNTAPVSNLNLYN